MAYNFFAFVRQSVLRQAVPIQSAKRSVQLRLEVGLCFLTYLVLCQLGHYLVLVGKSPIGCGTEGQIVILPKPKGMRMLNFVSKIPAEILMKMTRFNEPQILAILRQAEGAVPVAELCREQA